jgi:hypothetical protein
MTGLPAERAAFPVAEAVAEPGLSYRVKLSATFHNAPADALCKTLSAARWRAFPAEPCGSTSEGAQVAVRDPPGALASPRCAPAKRERDDAEITKCGGCFV